MHDLNQEKKGGERGEGKRWRRCGGGRERVRGIFMTAFTQHFKPVTFPSPGPGIKCFLRGHFSWINFLKKRPTAPSWCLRILCRSHPCGPIFSSHFWALCFFCGEENKKLRVLKMSILDKIFESN